MTSVARRCALDIAKNSIVLEFLDWHRDPTIILTDVMKFYSINAVVIATSFMLTVVSGSPASFPASSSLGLVYQSPNISLARPPAPAACSESLGRVTKRHCFRAINRLPHDAAMQPVVRNFYASPRDMNPFMLNQQLPIEKSYGKNPTVSVLLEYAVLTFDSRGLHCSVHTCCSLG